MRFLLAENKCIFHVTRVQNLKRVQITKCARVLSKFRLFWLFMILFFNENCRKSFSILNFKLQFFSSSPPSCPFGMHARHAWFHKLANHVREPLPWHWKTDMDIFSRTFRLFSRNLSICMFFSFRSRKFVPPLFRILRSLGVFISAKCCGSFNKFSTYFLQSLDSSLFFSVNGFISHTLINGWLHDF